jgi:hypothetical protein
VPRVPREAKERSTEPLSEPTRAHLDAVWLAVGAALFIGGLTLVTAGWLGHVALVVAAKPFQTSLGDEIFEWFLVGVGALMFFSSIYILRAFFRASRLPRTLRQQHDEEEKARARLPLSVSEAPKTQEAFKTR